MNTNTVAMSASPKHVQFAGNPEMFRVVRIQGVDDFGWVEVTYRSDCTARVMSRTMSEDGIMETSFYE